MSRATIWRQVRAGLFPPPVDSSGLENTWPKDDVDYFDALVAAGFSRKEATALVMQRRAARAAQLLGQASLQQS